LRVPNGQYPAGSGIGDNDRSRFSLHEMGYEGLQTVCCAQVHSAGESSEKDSQTSAKIAELKWHQIAPHGSST
jgi:hypothetical protein